MSVKKYEFKLLYFSLETECKLFVQVTEKRNSWISAINHRSYSWTQTPKISDLFILVSLNKSEECLYLQKSHTYQERNIFTFFLLFCLCKTSKNKNVTGNIIHNSDEMILLCGRTVGVTSFPTLTLTECEDKV